MSSGNAEKEEHNQHKAIEPEKLEAGMVVAYPYTVSIGWNRYFRYPRWVGASIKSVTPEHTKAVLEFKDGCMMAVDLKKHDVYELDADMEYENECVHMYKECKQELFDYNTKKWKSLSSLPDTELKEVHTLLTALNKLMKKEN